MLAFSELLVMGTPIVFLLLVMATPIVFLTLWFFSIICMVMRGHQLTASYFQINCFWLLFCELKFILCKFASQCNFLNHGLGLLNLLFWLNWAEVFCEVNI